jgi:putative copper export protein
MALIETSDRALFASDGPLMRAILSVNGLALLVAAAGLWLLPGSNLGADLLLMKLGLSVFMVLVAVTLLARARPHRRD